MLTREYSALSAPLREIDSPARINEITGIIIEVAIEIHRRLGPGKSHESSESAEKADSTGGYSRDITET
jgi:hypothetical protein